MKTTLALALLAAAILAPSASAAKTCMPPASPTAGGQFTSLKVKISGRVTCQKGKKEKRKTVSLGYRHATAG